MASKKYDVVAITGTYTDRQSGQERARFLNIGSVIATDKGFRLKLEAIPVEWNGWAMFKEPSKREGPAPAGQQATKPSADSPNDDIPF